MTYLAEHAGGTAGTELTLAGAHADTCASPQVDEIMDMELVDGKLHLAHTHLFALTDERAVLDGLMGYLFRECAVTAYLRKAAR